MDKLRERLRAADYSFDFVVSRLGTAATAALGRNSTVLARRLLDNDPQATLIRLWLLHDAVRLGDLHRAVGDSVELLVRAGFIEVSGDAARALVEIRPYADDSTVDAWVCADLIPGLDGQSAPTRSDFVLGASPASATLTHISQPGENNLALDLGTGCGVQSLHLATRSQRVIATDVNPRALRLARWTAELAGVEIELRQGSLFEPVAGELFDQIVTNPPYVMSPPDADKLTYREGGFSSDDLVRHVVSEGGHRLAPGGSMQVLANWAIVSGQPWEERVTGWVSASGCDGLVVLREALDPAEYVEIWLADAGLVGHADYRRRYSRWLDYFDELGIEGIGMGWFTLANSGHETPIIECETLAEATIGPVGPALAAFHRGVSATRGNIWSQRWIRRGRVRQTTIGLPGASDPEGIGLRQYYGLGRRVDVDTVMAAIVGACDGELTLRQIVESVAQLLDVPVADIEDDIATKFCQLIRQDWFVVDGTSTSTK